MRKGKIHSYRVGILNDQNAEYADLELEVLIDVIKKRMNAYNFFLDIGTAACFKIQNV